MPLSRVSVISPLHWTVIEEVEPNWSRQRNFLLVTRTLIRVEFHPVLWHLEQTSVQLACYDPKIVGYRENARHTIRPYASCVLIRIAVNHSVQLHVSVSYDDADWFLNA